MRRAAGTSHRCGYIPTSLFKRRASIEGADAVICHQSQTKSASPAAFGQYDGLSFLDQVALELLPTIGR